MTEEEIMVGTPGRSVWCDIHVTKCLNAILKIMAMGYF